MSLAKQLKSTGDNMLGTLDDLLVKAEQNGGDDLLSERLAPDMLPLSAQVRIACDQISAALKRTSLAASSHSRRRPARRPSRAGRGGFR